ncbi:uncharacterized protein PFL1_06150 [Pseudozyma flocculosa PF-1]|nr:uncharacterized protein PFL1_06150 [Pseudozyma flocculosa PF-1]EPQ26215.1 hypothetical protein PFL1_06150 [Pseudozyma flocculosa PF-1]
MMAETFRGLVERHVPVVIPGLLRDRPRLWREWQRTSYLVDRMGGRDVVVALTPDGRADDLVPLPSAAQDSPPSSSSSSSVGKEGQPGERPGGAARVFALPYDVTVPFDRLIDQLARQQQQQQQRCEDAEAGAGCVAYLQSQNSNLDTAGPLSGDLAPLFEDLCAHDDGSIRADIDWATEAMGQHPEATNIWIGTGRSTTSMHRDHYENLFTVVRGTKTFTVFPPNEGRFLCDDEEFDVYRYRPTTSSQTSNGLPTELELHRDRETPRTRWIPIDPTQPKTSLRNRRYVHRHLDAPSHCQDDTAASNDKSPAPDPALQRYGYALPPLTIRVEAGDTLYLPSGWYHHVAQQEDQGTPGGEAGPDLCLCLNWWYEISDDMALRLAEMDDGTADLDAAPYEQ